MGSLSKMESLNCSILSQQYLKDNLPDSEKDIPLFSHTVLEVITRPIGNNGPHVLCRSDGCDKKLAEITDNVTSGYEAGTEGMLYILYRRSVEYTPVPIYVGISEAIGKSGKLSVLFTSSRKKPRFDDYDGHHLGNLSSVVIEGHFVQRHEKEHWAKRMFQIYPVAAPTKSPKLNFDVFFWAKAWTKKDTSIITTLGHTPLVLEESILIHIFRNAHPNELLNRQGNRQLASEDK